MDNGSETYSVLNLTQTLLDAISGRDWETYVNLVDEKLTCVEKETGNSLYEGLELHKTYFDLPYDSNIVIKENILQPIIKVVGDISIICYKRLKQITNLKEKNVTTESYTETRVWRRTENSWKLIHFHKS